MKEHYLKLENSHLSSHKISTIAISHILDYCETWFW